MNRTCPTCGSAFETDRPGGLCPKCLLGEGLSEATIPRGAPRCPKCGSSIGANARFCDQCGTPAAPTVAEGDSIRAALEAKLGAEYRIIRLLGRGGMGAVYLAKDLVLEREVAVKVIRTVAHDRDTYDRFRREAKTAARLSHPNIVPLHTFGEVEGMPYFVMGYVRGESLAERLRRDGKMSEEDGLRVLAEIAGALDHAHRQGVVHRDIKPDNVLIEDESGRALLTDFGVARALGRGETQTFSGAIVGTPHYMSPEQAAGHGTVDPRSDIYSLGVMAYGILAGRLPFEGATAADVLHKHLTQEPPTLRSFNDAVSHSTAQAVERCLAKDPSKRWPDARSLKLALGTADDGQLPDALQAVEGRGIPGLGIAIAYLTGFGMFGELNGFWDDGGLIFFISHIVVIVLLYLFVLGRVKRQGFTTSQSQGAIWREPSWWLWWYPEAWRRRGNVWERLPREVPVIRMILPLIWIGMPAIVFPLQVYFESFEGVLIWQSPLATAVVLSPLVAMIAVWIVADARLRRKLKENGISGEDLNRIIHSTPPSRVSFWRRPHIAVILAPASDDAGASSSNSPHEHFQTILRTAGELSGARRPLGAEAASAARLLLASIEDADREIAELARSLEAGEEKRLMAKIAALEGPDAAPLRTLLEKQLELIRGLSERMEEEKELRTRRVEMLRSLSLHLAMLRARTGESSETLSVTERVRALCDDIAAQTASQFG